MMTQIQPGKKRSSAPPGRQSLKGDHRSDDSTAREAIYAWNPTPPAAKAPVRMMAMNAGVAWRLALLACMLCLRRLRVRVMNHGHAGSHK